MTFSAILKSGVIPAAQGIETAYFQKQAYRNGKSFERGENYGLSGLQKVSQVHFAQKQAMLALNAGRGPTKIPYMLSWLPAVSSLAVSFVASRKIKSPLLRKVVHAVHDNIGNLALLITTVSSVALIVFGQIALGVATITWLGVGMLDRYGILPEKLRRVIHTSDFYVSNVFALMLGDPFEKVISIVDIGVFLVGKVAATQAKRREQKRAIGTPNLTVAKVLAMKETPETQVNRNHVEIDPMTVEAEEAPLDDLIKMCDAIDWAKHLPVLKKKLAKDKRWINREQKAGEEIAFLKKNLASYVSSIKRHHIATGEPSNYTILNGYLKHIAHHFKEQDEISRADMLMRLAIEGGRYCGPGKYEVAEDIYFRHIGETGELKLERRLHLALQRERSRTFQAVYRAFWTGNAITNTLRKAVDFQDVLVYNQFSKILSKDCGHPANGAEADTTALTSPLEELIYHRALFKLRRVFWNGGKLGKETIEGYTQDCILKAIEDTLETHHINEADIYLWWKEWLGKQQEVSPADKERFNDLLLNGGLSNKEGGIKSKYIIAMLIEIDVLKHREV